MKNKKGFTLIELIVVIAILGILALFLVPSFMGYARDAKVQVMKANVKTGQDAYMYAWTKYEDVKVEPQENVTVEEKQKKLIEQEVCGNLENVGCVFAINGGGIVTSYPAYQFAVGSTNGLEQNSTITYHLDKNNFCVYFYGDTEKNVPKMWMCTVNGEKLPNEIIK